MWERKGKVCIHLRSIEIDWKTVVKTNWIFYWEKCLKRFSALQFLLLGFSIAFAIFVVFPCCYLVSRIMIFIFFLSICAYVCTFSIEPIDSSHDSSYRWNTFARHCSSVRCFSLSFYLFAMQIIWNILDNRE